MKNQSVSRRQDRAWRGIAAAICVGLLGGCAVGPDFTRPQAPKVSSYWRAGSQEDGPKFGEGDRVPDKWWSVYGSARINALVDLALQRNPNVDVAVANLKQAQEYVTAQRGLYFPQVQAGYGITRQNSGQTLASPLNSGDNLFTLHTGQLNIGFVPDIFGGNRRQVESLQAFANSQKYQLDALRITIASNVTSGAIQEQLLLEQIAIVEDAVGAAEEQVKHARILLRAGYSSGLDLAQQEAAYTQTLALLPPLKKQLELTRDMLAVLCGHFPEADLGPGAAAPLKVPPELPNVLPSQLVQHRPDIRAAEESLHATHAQIGVAVANMLPQFSLLAGVAYTNPSADRLFSDANQTWSVLGSLTAPLFSGGTLSARKRAAVQAAAAAQAQYKNVVLTAFQNVSDVLYALGADGKSMHVAADSERANQRVFALTEQQFSSGYVSRPQLLAARQAWLTAKLGRVAAQAAYLGDTVALYQALGGGWVSDADRPD